jgi:predicted component of type VI protein secretion system
MPTQYQFKMKIGPTPDQVFVLEGNSASIGRESGNAVVINDPEVSRRHVKLTLQGESYVIEDLGSTNGTFVNQTRLTGPYMLKHGDVVSLGEQITLIYEVSATDPNATMISTAKPIISTPPPATPPFAVEPLPASTPITTSPAVVSYNPESYPAYAGQVPVSASVPLEPVRPANNTTRTVIVIAVIALLLCCVCGCIGLLWYIDANKLWCDWTPFLVPLLGGTCP